MKKKLLSVLLATALLFSLLTFSVSAASFSISASSSVTVGKNVTVTVTVSDSAALGNWKFRVSYNSDLLEYKSMDSSSLKDGTMNCSGGGGSLLLSGWSNSSGGTKNPSCKITFNAKKVGTAKISLSSVEVNAFSGSPLSVGSASKNINIVAAPQASTDNTLSSLAISPGELTPAFDKNTTAYTATVPFEVSSVTVSATANHKKASVTTSETALSVGENPITVTVRAENGSTKTYTVTVTRLASELSGVTTQVDGITYTVAYDPAALTPPEGYTATTKMLGDKKILAYASPQETIHVVYLMSESRSDWYVYHEASATFSKMVTLNGLAAGFVILPVPADQTLPAGFIPAEIAIGEESVSAYQYSDTALKNIFLVYAMEKDGKVGFYYYDSALSSFLSYFDISAHTGADPSGGTASSADLKEAEQRADRAEIIALILAIVAVSLLTALISVLVLRRKKKPDFEETLTLPTAAKEEKASLGAGETLLIMGEEGEKGKPDIRDVYSVPTKDDKE